MGSNSAFLKLGTHFSKMMEGNSNLFASSQKTKGRGKSRKTKIEKAAERSPEEQKELDENYKESVERTIDEDKTELAKLNYDFKRLSVRKLGIDEMINGKNQDSLFAKKRFIVLSLLFSFASFLPIVVHPNFWAVITPICTTGAFIFCYVLSWIQTQTKKNRHEGGD